MSLRQKYFIFAALLAVALVAAVMFVRSNSIGSLIRKDLEEVARSGKSAGFLKNFDTICFNFNTANVRGEFLALAERTNQPFVVSLKACGIENSCCNLNSEVGGVIGLVKGSEIECVETKWFTFLTAAERPICRKPSDLKVSIKVFEGRTHPAGRIWTSTPGESYFQIEEE